MYVILNLNLKDSTIVAIDRIMLENAYIKSKVSFVYLKRMNVTKKEMAEIREKAKDNSFVSLKSTLKYSSSSI